jgi:hypothetical protein
MDPAFAPAARRRSQLSGMLVEIDESHRTAALLDERGLRVRFGHGRRGVSATLVDGCGVRVRDLTYAELLNPGLLRAAAREPAAGRPAA